MKSKNLNMLLCIAMAMVILFGLAACGGSNGSPADTTLPESTRAQQDT